MIILVIIIISSENNDININEYIIEKLYNK